MSRCGQCDLSCRFVPPNGPVPCEFLFIGEKPGREEDGKGIPFVGDAGKEFNVTYLRLAGLGRDNIRISNTVKCRLGGNNNKPSPEQIRACASHHLPSEVCLVAPRVIILMGATACSLVPDIELDKDHGIPKHIGVGECKEFFGDWGGWVWPMFHPAAGMHDTGMMIPLLEDFERLGEWRNGNWKQIENGNRKTDYQLIAPDDRRSIQRLIDSSDCRCPAIDTEDDAGEPWSVQFSFRSGQGALIYARDRDLLRYLFGQFGEFTFHFAAHDIGVLESLGIKVPRYRDTMQEAYHLGNQPQGLKALSWRLLGIRMQSWEDLVMPDSRRKAVDWLNDRWDDCKPVIGREDLDPPMKAVTKAGKPTKAGLNPDNIYSPDGRLIVARRTVTPTDAERDIKRILTHSHKPGYDIWEKVEEAELGNIIPAIPRPSIAHVDLKKAVYYACQDADVTGQVANKLARIRAELMGEGGDWNVREEDWDR